MGSDLSFNHTKFRYAFAALALALALAAAAASASESALAAEPDNKSRSFKNIFPTLTKEIISGASEDNGYYNIIEGESEESYPFKIIPSPKYGIDFNETVVKNHPDVIIETLRLIPYKEKKITITDIYNAVINLRSLQGREYFSHTRQRSIPLFEYVTRIESMKHKKELDDPLLLESYPEHVDVYIKLRDANFGTCYYRNVVDANPISISCVLSNADTLNIFFVPVIKTGNLEIHFFMEPVAEGLIMYAVTGVRMEKLAAHYVDVPSAIEKRFNVIVGWIVDGIGKYSAAKN
jgi:hypothetical protein